MQDLTLLAVTLLALLVRGPQFSVSNWSQMSRFPQVGRRI